uniref:site-specific integrase n=1 Tax=Sphingomonas sp. TaxID=28214 RepID=UPI0025E5682E|nr:site-specific integrase [Sphingomonas sp.]
MTKISILFRKDKLNQQGKAPINLKITNRGKRKYIATGYSVKLNEWDFDKNQVKSSYKNSARMNNTLRSLLVEYEAKLLEIESKDNYNSVSTIKNKMVSNKAMKLFPYAEDYKLTLKLQGKYGTYKRGVSVINKLKEFLKDDDILIEEFNQDMVKKYDLYLRETYKNTNTTIHANMKFLKTIILKYIKEGNMSYDKNPFINYIIKPDQSTRAYLTSEELLEIENLKLEENTNFYHHRNIYVFSAYAGGLRISDVLQLTWGNFQDEKLSLKIQKTKKSINIRIPQKAIDIINIYANENTKPNDLIFPLLKCKNMGDSIEVFNAISSATAYTNSDLKEIIKLTKIKKSISFHTARHTFATTALQKGMRIEYVSKYMGHSDIKETQIYAKIINQELDKAIEIFN